MLVRDLSTQRAAEREVRAQRELLAHVDRVNTLGEMAAGIAHEINQPLTAISMYASAATRLLQHTSPDSPQLVQVLEKLGAQALRAGAVIERMQELTRRRESRRENVDCTALIEEVHRLAEVEAQLRDMVIVVRCSPTLPRIHCDPIQIQQVILNLLRNGMESMADGQARGNKIVLQARRSGNQIRVSIVDSGCGISRDLAKQLYAPFTSTRESGMGLGLSISRSIIAAHGGKLDFHNNRNGGATFHFSLPISEADDSDC